MAPRASSARNEPETRTAYGADVEVALIRWPDEELRRRTLAVTRSPRLLLVATGAAPPSCDDPLEDWIRVPAAERDVDARVATLARRLVGDAPATSGGAPGLVTAELAGPGNGVDAFPPGVASPAASPGASGAGSRTLSQTWRTAPPVLDSDGVLRFGDGWVSLAPIEARVAAALVERFGAVVHRDTLAHAGWPQGAPGRNALDVHVLRLRRRLAPLGLSITTVRSRGYLLARATPSAGIPTGGDRGRGGVATG